MNRPVQLILSCEHGGNDVPDAFRDALDSPMARQHLRSHRGWDPGALEAARYFAEQSRAPLFHSTTTRLLVDLNRSLGHPQLFSRFTLAMPVEKRDAIIEHHYVPYRSQVQQALQNTIAQGRGVVHLSVHTFTPVFRGQRRKLEIGLLFDPSRDLETRLCETWRRVLASSSSRLRVELNQPYLGVDDGLTTAMRGQFSPLDYLGIELEINHRVMRRTEPGRRQLWSTLHDSLQQALGLLALSSP